MSTEEISSLQRVLKAVSHEKSDRVPLLLPFTITGAKIMGLGIEDYFNQPEKVVEAQLLLQRKYKTDFLIGIHYFAMEVQPFGGGVIFFEDGPPNSGKPAITREMIQNLKPPKFEHIPAFQNVLQTIRMLKNNANDKIPIIGGVISPFSLPIMQMGFDNYLNLLYDDEELFNHLMSVNEAFCIEWANKQIEAGATICVYFDPMSSPTIIPHDLFLRTGYKIAQRTLPKINAPKVFHFASGRTVSILQDLLELDCVGVGISVLDDLFEVKRICEGKLAVVGNLNAIEMRNWTTENAEKHVKNLLRVFNPNGGLIISDNHGEIPWQVPESILSAISDASKKWGTYPLDWIK